MTDLGRGTEGPHDRKVETMKIELEIKKAEVMLREGTDLVSLVTNKPYPFPAVVTNGEKRELRLQFEVVRNRGIRYCNDLFGIFPNIINTRH